MQDLLLLPLLLTRRIWRAVPSDRYPQQNRSRDRSRDGERKIASV
ncbi:MAG: hypothetical protein WA864_14655 [Acetobacteraceae bacterium]